jgi:membrane-associated protease RseP (regulator of RpoE activity)
MPIPSEADPSVTTCGNCRAPMPLGLRFCRNCGFRLGEGTAEYTETARFERSPTLPAGNGAATSVQSYATTYGVTSGPMTTAAGRKMTKRAKKMSGMTWMFLGLLIFFLSAAVFTAVVTPIRRGIQAEISAPAPPRAYFGVDSFETVDGGVTFDDVEPPNGPADKAGLVGGDIITAFDSKVVESEDEIMDLLGQTPIGKTVDVIYIRDGETMTTKLTTISKEDFDRLAREFRNRPERPGRFGFDDGDTERVPIAGTKMFGIRLDDISPNLPADMAGIKEGDVVIEFDNVPIRTRGELASRVRRAIPYSTVKVVLMRGTERLEIPVKMGRQ